MAVDIGWASQVSSVVSAQLNRRLRYRCLVFQSADVVTLGEVRKAVCGALASFGDPVRVVEYQDQFDSVGALSCDSVLERVAAAGAANPVVLAGPLHYLDYWSEQVATAFWRFLGGFTSGPGVVVVDGPREHGIEGAFRIVGRIAGTDIRFLKSRLASTQDGLV